MHLGKIFGYLLKAAAAALVLLALFELNDVERPELVNTGGRSFETARVVLIEQDNLQEDGSRIGDQQVRVRLTSGELAGAELPANSPNGLLFGTACEPGMSVIVILSAIGGQELCTVYSRDRSLVLAAFVLAFFLCLALIGGRKGLVSCLALLLTFAAFAFLLFPLLMRGVPPVLAATATALAVLLPTVYLMDGTGKKAQAVALASMGGVLTTVTTALLFGEAAGLSGYNVSNIEALLFVGQNTPVDVGALLFAGILLASLGAVMDIAMDVVAAVAEIWRMNPLLTARELFQSGLSVGRDVMGTMSATLMLAFFGGSLGMWMLNYAYNLPLLQLMNSNSVGIAVMQAFAASFGVIAAVPLSAAISVWLFTRS